MKRIISTSFAVIMLFFAAFKANAQAVDMSLLSPTVIPTPAGFPGTVTLSFDVIAEILDETLTSNDVSNSFAEITVTLSDLDGTGVMPTGAGADLFNWTYNPTTKTYKGTSKDATLTADTPYSITFVGVKTTQVTTGNSAGFQANLTPPGDLFVSDTNDDAVARFTNVVLPVTLVSFEVQKEGQAAQLKWATTEETNSDYFEIQHSVTGKQWAKIGNVASNGESTTLKNYTFSHSNPVNGENLYRLRMVDKDQTFAYSRIQSVKFDGAAKDLTIYPNPVADKLYLRDFKEITNIQIHDLSGQAVYQANGNTTGEINVSNLKSGMYIVKISRSNGLASSQKIVVRK